MPELNVATAIQACLALCAECCVSWIENIVRTLASVISTPDTNCMRINRCNSLTGKLAILCMFEVLNLYADTHTSRSVCLCPPINSALPFVDMGLHLVALYGKPYLKAAKDTWSLLVDRGIDAIVNDSLVNMSACYFKPPWTTLSNICVGNSTDLGCLFCRHALLVVRIHLSTM